MFLTFRERIFPPRIHALSKPHRLRRAIHGLPETHGVPGLSELGLQLPGIG